MMFIQLLRLMVGSETLRLLRGFAVLCLLAEPAGAASPPWAVESPGAARARFGLGLDMYFERLESLRIASSRTVVTTRDLLLGHEQTRVLDGDPELLNRKFDLRWELQGPGAVLPIALPAPRALRLFPSLILRAGSAEVSLDMFDRTRAEDSTRLEGRGAVLGVGLDVTTAACRSCPVYISSRYDFTEFGEREMDREPRLAYPPSFMVAGDTVRLGARTHELSTRVGYLFPGGRTASYAGLRARRTEIDIEDMVRFTSQGLETELDSRLRLETDTVLGFAGVDVHLAGPFYARTEAAFGEENRTLLLKVVYLTGASLGRLRPKKAAELAAELGRIRVEFDTEVARLAGMPEAAALAAAHEILRHLEAELLAAFEGPDFAAMRDYVQERFAQARALLPSPAGTTTTQRSQGLTTALPAAYRSAAAPTLHLARQEQAQTWLADLKGFLGPILKRLDELGADNDWYVDVCIRSRPQTAAKVTIQPRRYAPGYRDVSTDNLIKEVPRGLYVYWLTRDKLNFDCRPGSRRFKEGRCQRLLDLVNPNRPRVTCELQADSDACMADEMLSREVCRAGAR